MGSSRTTLLYPYAVLSTFTANPSRRSLDDRFHRVDTPSRLPVYLSNSPIESIPGVSRRYKIIQESSVARARSTRTRPLSRPLRNRYSREEKMNELRAETVNSAERRLGSLADRPQKAGLARPRITQHRLQHFVNFPSGDHVGHPCGKSRSMSRRGTKEQRGEGHRACEWCGAASNSSSFVNM